MNKAHNFIDLTGQSFGRLTVLSQAESRLSGVSRRVKTRWNCACSCGNECVAEGPNLRTGDTKSCGCVHRERAETFRISHGLTRGGVRHPAYSSWANMLQRCRNPENPNWRYYGGRGITVCERWREFQNFLSDMGDRPTPKHTVERKGTNGNYEPGNCLWATRKEQANNTRTNRIVTVDFCSLTASQWEKERGFRRGVIHQRLGMGWSERDAVMRPLARGRKPVTA